MQCNFVVSKLAGYPSPQSCNIYVGETFFFRVLPLTLSFHNYLLTIVIPIRFPSLDLTGRIFMMQFSMFPWLPFDFLPATRQRRLGLCLWVSVRGCFTNKLRRQPHKFMLSSALLLAERLLGDQPHCCQG